MHTPTTNYFAHSSSLRDTENFTDYSSSLLILPGPAAEVVAGDSLQQPSGQSLYVRLPKEDDNWRVSGILHDFNNQLAIILSHCSIALNKLPTDSNARS
ncbi:MAG: hypothetical protein R2932_30895, partial [Caldilineaceae bacterium]